MLVTPGNGVNVQYRDGQGASAQVAVGTVAESVPVYLRADRVGTTFTAYTSHDDVNWALVPGSSVSLPALAGDLLAGPAVTSHNAGATSAATFDFVRVNECPGAWQCGDIGAPSVPSSQFLDKGTWSLEGVGGDIGGVGDQFHYVWQNVTGDSGMSAQLTSQYDTGTQAKAGLMYRADNTAGAPYYMAAMTANNGLVVQARTTTGGGSTTVATASVVALPLYLQVTRSGNTFTAYTSSDNATWIPIANSSVVIGGMPGTAQIGMAVDSNDPSAMSTANFDTFDITGTTDTPPSSGTDLSVLDTSSVRYTQADNNAVRLRLYTAPIGTSSQGQWQQRDTSLNVVTATGMLRSANLAFTEQIAPPTSTMPMLASLTSEDGVTLSVGLATPMPTPSTSTGGIRTNSVTYAGAEPSGTTAATSTSDLSLRSTMSGIDARIVIHNSSESGSFGLALSADSSAQVTQDVSGTIQVTRIVTGYVDDGVTPYTATQVEYSVQPPALIDSNTAITAPVSTGPATATLTSGPGAQQIVTLNVDKAWLNDPSRVFPVNLDLPIVTGSSRAHEGMLGTVNSCRPNAPAPRTGMVVGSAGGCAYNGQMYFDTTSIPYDASIVSATLRLYTPAQTTATGVQAYPDAPTSVDDPASQMPTWNTASTIMTGSVGFTQGGSDGHWQSWDVTSLVQGWVQDATTNGGLTLASNGSPVLFSSPLGTGGTDPSFAPYLDVTYAPMPAGATPGPFNDTGGRGHIYGISGSFKPSETYQGLQTEPTSYTYANDILCPGTSKKPSCGGDMAVRAIDRVLGGSFMRFSVNMECPTPSAQNPNPSAYDPAWWTTVGPRGSAAFSDVDLGPGQHANGIEAMLANAYLENLVPIVTFVVDGNPACDNFLGHTSSDKTYLTNWQQEMHSFVDAMAASAVKLSPKSTLTVGQLFGKRYIYFEIGNEQNYNDAAFFGPNPPRTNYYPPIFAAATTGLYGTPGQYSGLGDTAQYRVLTTGMVEPSASRTIPGPGGSQNNYQVAVEAIRQARARLSKNGVRNPNAELGFAVHPYGYDTPNNDPTLHSGPWRNFYSEYPTILNVNGVSEPLYNDYAGPQRNLDDMISLWSGGPRKDVGGSPLPVVFTEDNWSNEATVRDDPKVHQHCQNPDGCQGAYLVDLFTKLDDQMRYQRLPITKFPVRIAWYRGADKAEPPPHTGAPAVPPVLGIFHGAGAPKKVLISTCYGRHESGISMTKSIDYYYRLLVNPDSSCY